MATGDGSDPGAGPQPDILVLGPAGRGWSTTTVRRVGAAVLVLAVLVGLGDVASRRLAAAEPTLAEAEVVRLYSNTGTRTPGALDWDPTTVWVQHTGDTTTELDVSPQACAPLLSFGDLSNGVSSVTVQLGPTTRGRMDANAGTLVTLLFRDPAAARERFERVVAALEQCLDFRDSDSELALDEKSVDEHRRHRSDAVFRLAIAEEPGLRLRVRLVRFGNTLTWSVTQDRRRTANGSDPPPTGGGSGAELPDRVVLGLQQAYRRRE